LRKPIQSEKNKGLWLFAFGFLAFRGFTPPISEKKERDQYFRKIKLEKKERWKQKKT
jgi:hypothetical protein